VFLGYVSYFQSRLSVTPREALDPSKPFSVPLIVADDGYLSFRGVTYQCYLRDMVNEGDMRGADLMMPEMQLGEIDPGAPATASCSFVTERALVTTRKIISADITVIIRYRPVLLPWRKERKFRLVTAETADHHLVWLPQPDLPEKYTK
jgi:hypothetical protein